MLFGYVLIGKGFIVGGQVEYFVNYFCIFNVVCVVLNFVVVLIIISGKLGLGELFV